MFDTGWLQGGKSVIQSQTVLHSSLSLGIHRAEQFYLTISSSTDSLAIIGVHVYLRLTSLNLVVDFITAVLRIDLNANVDILVLDIHANTMLFLRAKHLALSAQITFDHCSGAFSIHVHGTKFSANWVFTIVILSLYDIFIFV